MVLAIYGASGLGREVLELAKAINEKENRWQKFVFIDDGDVPSVVDGCDVYKYDVAKKLFDTNLQIAMGIGEPLTREKLFKKIKADNNQNNYIENKTPIEKQEIEKKISQELNEKDEEKLNLKDKDKKIQKKEEYIPYSCITGLEKDDLSFPKPLTEK